MADTTFIDRQTVITAAWLNDVNDFVYQSPATADAPRHAAYYGISSTSTADQSTKIQQAIDYVKANGGYIYFPPGTYYCKNLRLENGTKAWGIVGAGPEATVFRHIDGNGNFFTNSNLGSTVGITLRGFTIDGRYSETLAPSANNMVAISNASNVLLHLLRIKDFKEAGVLIYSPTSTAHTMFNNWVIDCIIDGNSQANVGANLSNVDRSGYVRVQCINGNKAGTPGFGLQFKEDCDDVSWTDCIVQGWAASYASGGTGYSVRATMTGCKSYNSDNAISGHFKYSTLSCLSDQNNLGQSCVDITDSSIGNTIYISVDRLATAKSAIRFRNGATENFGYVQHMSNWGVGAKAATFDAGAIRNGVVLQRTSGDPSTWAVPDLVTFGATTDGNGFRVEGLETWEPITIAAGAALVANSWVNTIRLDTEGAAASDDLDTITITGVKDGQKVTLRTTANARDVVVRHLTGNIALNSATNFTLSHANDRVTLSFGSGTSNFCETGRGDNGT